MSLDSWVRVPPPASYFGVCTIILLILPTVLVFAQSGEEVEHKKMNQTMQDISKSTIQPIQNESQTTTNDTDETFPIQKNVTDLGANITEGAKDVVGKLVKD
jgi:hypothetical protein